MPKDPDYFRGRKIRHSIETLEGSLIRKVAETNIGRDDVIALWFGEPNEATPDFIKQAATAALDDNRVFYAQNRGIPALREILSTYVSNLHGRPMDIDRLTVTASGMNAIMLVSEVLIDNGDNMVVVGPVWPNCRQTVQIMGGEARQIALQPDQNGRWQLDMDALFDACDERTRAIFVNSPGNPTGWVMAEAEQRAMLDECKRRGLYVIADEVYVRLAFDVPKAPSFLDFAEADDPLIVINSFSKTWSMTGWRLGWLTHPPALGEVFSVLNEFNIASPTTFVQHAGVAAVRDGEAFVTQMVEEYRRNRDLVFQRLAAMPKVSLYRPEAAFYAFFAVDGMTDSLEYAKHLIATTGVGLAPGRAFGDAGEGWLRLCFASQPALLSQALDRLEPALS
ncbi:MAG: pyridoxal phosphate-dependent aminotransferase [Alphaproteobacteria bacterium]|nr:pyridoxal phosphate-dependent aminotransferase [Alphaproteobacteria bacterium]